MLMDSAHRFNHWDHRSPPTIAQLATQVAMQVFDSDRKESGSS
jgi:hypothetical protein